MTNMKNKSIILLLTLGLAFTACSRDEESLFEKSAAERTVEALENAQKCLTEAPNGWEFLYFCNPDTRGYNILVKFDEHGEVTATAKNIPGYKDIVTDTNSVWQVMSDYGPILSFNTYNDVLHLWADPGEDGDGYLGDYEFLILEATPERIILKGKKHSAYSVMRRLPKDQDWTEYFTDIENMQKQLFGNSNLFLAEIGSEKYTLTKGATGIFTFANKGEAPDAEDPTVLPFVTTQEGIFFSAFLTDDRYQALKLNEGVLKADAITMSAGNLAEHFEYYLRLVAGYWKLDIKDANANLKDKITAFDTKLKVLYDNKRAVTKNLRWEDMNGSKTEKALRYIYSSNGTDKELVELVYLFNVTNKNGQLVVEYKGPGDDNARNMLEKIPEIADVMKALNGTFNLTATEPINPTLGLQITDNNDASKWIKLTGSLK